MVLVLVVGKEPTQAFDSEDWKVALKLKQRIGAVLGRRFPRRGSVVRVGLIRGLGLLLVALVDHVGNHSIDGKGEKKVADVFVTGVGKD